MSELRDTKINLPQNKNVSAIPDDIAEQNILRIDSWNAADIVNTSLQLIMWIIWE